MVFVDLKKHLICYYMQHCTIAGVKHCRLRFVYSDTVFFPQLAKKNSESVNVARDYRKAITALQFCIVIEC